MKLRIIELSTDRLPCPPRKGGAIETYVYGISKTLAMIGSEVHLITIERRKDVDYGKVCVHAIDISSPMAVKLRELFSAISTENSNIPYLTIKLLRLFDVIENLFGEIHVIHSHYFTVSFAPLLFKYFMKKNIITVTHLHNEPKSNIINKILLNKYDVVLAVSRYVKQSTINRLNVDSKKIGIVYNAVDTEFFKPCNPSEIEEKKKRFGVFDNSLVISFIGRITPEKGLHHLLLASKILAQKGYKFKLLISGPAGQFDKENFEGYPKLCFNLINSLNISGYVKYLGGLERKDLRDLYYASDLLVVPSIGGDSCPTVVLEAMATGKPVVAYPSGGIPELIPTYGGIVVNKIDPNHLAEAIEMIMENSVSIDSNALIKWVQRKFSYHAIAQKLLKLFSRIMNET
jgi:glycosyltransferase involved in cell wall biosynthesis